MRSALITFRSALPRESTRVWSDEMRWLAGELGDARDLDVFVEEALSAVSGRLPLAGEKELLALIQDRRTAAYDKVRAMLDGERYLVFKREFGDWLAGKQWLSADLKDKKRKRLAANVVPFSRKILDKLERKVLSQGSQIDVNAEEDMHQLRIECKKLRYAAEFFSPVFTGMDEFIGHMRGLQDLLGVMNDVMVMPGLLEGLFDGKQDRVAAEYAGGVVGWRTHEYYVLLEHFDDRWNEFVNAKHPWWKKSAIIRG
jgi:CHAD domain-containing protein